MYDPASVQDLGMVVLPRAGQAEAAYPDLEVHLEALGEEPLRVGRSEGSEQYARPIFS